MSNTKKTRRKQAGKYSYSGKSKPTIKSDEFAGIGAEFDRGYVRFCLKKKNALGKKCNRSHLLPTGFTFGSGKTKTVK